LIVIIIVIATLFAFGTFDAPKEVEEFDLSGQEWSKEFQCFAQKFCEHKDFQQLGYFNYNDAVWDYYGDNPSMGYYRGESFSFYFWCKSKRRELIEEIKTSEIVDGVEIDVITRKSIGHRGEDKDEFFEIDLPVGYYCR